MIPEVNETTFFCVWMGMFCSYFVLQTIKKTLNWRKRKFNYGFDIDGYKSTTLLEFIKWSKQNYE